MCPLTCFQESMRLYPRKPKLNTQLALKHRWAEFYLGALLRIARSSSSLGMTYSKSEQGVTTILRL